MEQNDQGKPATIYITAPITGEGTIVDGTLDSFAVVVKGEIPGGADVGADQQQSAAVPFGYVKSVTVRGPHGPIVIPAEDIESLQFGSKR